MSVASIPGTDLQSIRAVTQVTTDTSTTAQVSGSEVTAGERISTYSTNINDYQVDDFVIQNYQHHPPIKVEMVV